MNNRIAEIKARCEAATPSPWEVEKYYHDEPYEQFIKFAAVVSTYEDGSKGTIMRNNWSNPVVADLEFIAHAREDIPYLLSQLAERDKEIEQLKESQRWIPVSERLPDDDVPVLATYIGFIDKKPHSDAVAKWSIELNGYNGGWAWEIDGSDVNVAITHWMPMPEPPEKGQDMTEIDKAIYEILGTNYGEVQCHRETMVLAVAALREQAEKSKGCVWCKADNQVTHNGEHFCFFCSYCGRRLEGKDGN